MGKSTIGSIQRYFWGGLAFCGVSSTPETFIFGVRFWPVGCQVIFFFKTFQKSTKRHFFQNFSKINKKGFTNTLLVQLWLNGTIFHQKGRLLGQNHCFQNFGAFGIENRSFKGRLRDQNTNFSNFSAKNCCLKLFFAPKMCSFDPPPNEMPPPPSDACLK